MKKIFIAIGILALAGISALFAQPKNPQETTRPVATPHADYKSISYTLDDQTVLLKDGLAEMEAAPDSASKKVTKYFGNEVRADMNGDGLEDVAFLLTQEMGGSGTFYYVVAALAGPGGYEGTNGVLLGDRIAPQTTEFKDGLLVVNYADRQEGQAMTELPSVGISKYFKVASNALFEVSR